MPSKSPRLPLPGFRWRGLTWQIFAWVILPIIILMLIATFGSFALHQGEMRTMVGVLDERTVRTAASALSQALNSRGTLIYELSSAALDDASGTQILASSNSLTQVFDAGLALFTPDGNLLESHGQLFESGSFLPTFSTILNQALLQASATPSFYSLSSDASVDQSLILIVASAGTRAPIIVGAVTPGSLVNATLGSVLSGEQGSDFYLIDQHGDFLYTSDAQDQSTDPFSLPDIDAESGSTYIQRVDGEHVVAYSRVHPTEWILVFEEPWKSVATPTLNTTLITPLALAPVLLLALVALWFGALQIVQPLQNLETRARHLAWGDFDSIQESVGGIEEISRLQNTLIYLAEKVGAAQRGLRSYIGAITTGQEDERRRLARELHDQTIQALIALNQRVQLAQMDNKNIHTAAQLTEIETLTQGTIRDLRQHIHALRPLYLTDLGLVAALDMLARETGASTGLTVTFQHHGQERRLPSETELALYRITQEGLSNITRHAAAQLASISLIYSADSISLTISDNGIGFSPPQSPSEFAPSGHFGLLGLYERAELIAAKLDIRSEPGAGTDLLITLPIDGA